MIETESYKIKAIEKVFEIPNKKSYNPNTDKYNKLNKIEGNISFASIFNKENLKLSNMRSKDLRNKHILGLNILYRKPLI